MASVINPSQQEESTALWKPGTFLQELAWVRVQRAKWSCWSRPRLGAALLPSAPPTCTLLLSLLLASSPWRETGKGEGFHLKWKKKKKKKERSCEKPGMEEGMETSSFQGKDAVAAVLGTVRQVITRDDSVLGKLNWLFIKSVYLGRW